MWAVETAPKGLAYGEVCGCSAPCRRFLSAQPVPACHNVRLRGRGCVPTRVGGFRGGTPSRRGFNRPPPYLWHDP